MDVAHLLGELKRRFNIETFIELEKVKKRPKVKEDSFWVDSFHQIYVENSSKERDDLVFIVRYDVKQGREQIEVFRRDAVSLPSPRDETVLWEQTLYLNFLLHEFEYHVTCGVVTVEGGVVDSVSQRVVQQVYPSPNRRRMDKKDSVSDMIYPNVMFHVDNFEEVFRDVCSNVPGEKIAVQLVASNKSADVKQLMFLGAIDHSALKDAYDKQDETRRSGLSSKWKMSLKSRSSRVFDFTGPYRFVRMRGPHSKGFAEVAVWKEDLSLSKLQTSISLNSSGSNHFFGASDSSNSHPNKSSSFQDHSDGSVVHVERVVDEDDNSDFPAAQETGGSFSKLKSFFSKKPEPPERRDSVSSAGVRMYAYLTFLQLPWYTLIDDILNCTKDKAL